MKFLTIASHTTKNSWCPSSTTRISSDNTHAVGAKCCYVTLYITSFFECTLSSSRFFSWSWFFWFCYFCPHVAWFANGEETKGARPESHQTARLRTQIVRDRRAARPLECQEIHNGSRVIAFHLTQSAFNRTLAALNRHRTKRQSTKTGHLLMKRFFASTLQKVKLQYIFCSFELTHACKMLKYLIEIRPQVSFVSNCD